MTGYKGKEGHAKRAVLIDALLATAPWLRLTDDARSTLADSDDARDALVSALVARTAARGLVQPIETE